ncbi:hypothetical protein EZV62_009539 [Acer yangbiense]|uniref:Uncharacterized protein n=1 Tax=Acer yangbiense TaxID=1000413 RepID=A0A5C7I0F4_9ROSI|nr:hypothetical protein EZV62_009539 [Acer yangbiense]
MEGIPDPDVVVSPDDPDDPNDPMVSTDYVVKKREKPMFNRSGKRKPVQVKDFKSGNDNELESSSSKHEKHQPNDTKIEIEQLEKILGASLNDIHEPLGDQCCIYKVPKDLRNIDTKAYTPQVISIGPFHFANPALTGMEKQKIRYALEFCRREGAAEKLKEFETFIHDNEKHIRNCYQEISSLLKIEFVKVIIRDAVFIIEFFLRSAEPVEKRGFDLFLDTPCVRAPITRDLQLLENQLPYFVLKKLFELGAFHNFSKEDYPDSDPFLILSHRFFFNPKDGGFPEPKNKNEYKIQHFTDLRRHFLLMDFLPQDQKQGEHVGDLPTATELHWSGVKFTKGIEGRCEYGPRAVRIPYFKSYGELRIPFTKELTLQIPRFVIDDYSECLYRNLMALELWRYKDDTHICNFILLMDRLINTEKDVDLLVDQKIIFSRLGDNATVATMFNNLGLQITPSKSVYHSLGKMLKEHYDSHGWVRFLNRNMATLITVYFGDLWTATKTFAAVILLVLTFIQAVYSIR